MESQTSTSYEWMRSDLYKVNPRFHPCSLSFGAAAESSAEVYELLGVRSAVSPLVNRVWDPPGAMVT